jgi:DNA polymerase-3 subunit epsilon
MLTQARGLDVTPTGSALEAAVLESDEIKRHSPPYNIALRRRHRQLAFCAQDLTRHARTVHKDYPVGPLPAGRTVQALAAFGLWFRDGMPVAGVKDNCIGHLMLTLPPEYAPEIDCLQAGFEIFREHHHGRFRNQDAVRFLTGLGAGLWQKKIEAAALSETAAEAPDDKDDIDTARKESGDTAAWTPEAVAGAIEAMIRRSAHLIRRARWFCLLSESSLAWTSTAQSGRNKNLVVFKNGAVTIQDKVKASDKTMLPPGYANSFRARQNNIDLITYDRLRVVTTEIRRILSEGRHIELRLGPKVSLGRQELTKALQWV